MSEKKYTPEEAARKVLEKCQQLYNETKMEKSGGVHSEAIGLKGQSVQGMKQRDANKAKDKGDYKEAANLIESAKRGHQAVLEDSKAKSKPNLPKSERSEERRGGKECERL